MKYNSKEFRIRRGVRFLLFLILEVSIIFTSLGCFQKENNKKRELLILGGLLYLNSQSSGDFNCKTSPSPVSFAEFITSIDGFNTSTSKCGDCHGVNTAQANFIITNYSSIRERVNPGNPNTSTLYFKVKPGGAMNAYSNTQINQSIYCWIANGANP